MKKTIIAIITAANILFFSSFTKVCAGDNVSQEPQLPNAASCILIDSKTGMVLYEKNSHARLYPASTTKVLTAAVALELAKSDQLMTASHAAVRDIGKDGMNIGIMAGEQLYFEDLLKALLITSANETANIIAENLFESRQNFIDYMNKKALELGARDTHFVNASGMHHKEHYTTAADMAIFARYAMTFPKFREIVSTVSYRLPPTNKHESWPILYTTNRLIRHPDNSRWKSDIFTFTGIKTGFTEPAGFNLVASARNNNGMELISVVMCVKNYDNASGLDAKTAVNVYTKRLMDYGFSNFAVQTVVKKGDKIAEFSVNNSKDNAPLVAIADRDIQSVLPVDAYKWNIHTDIEKMQNLQAPIAKDTIIGKLKISREGILLGEANLVSAHDIETKNLIQKIVSPESKSIGSHSDKNNKARYILIFSAIIIVLASFFAKKRCTGRKIHLQKFNMYKIIRKVFINLSKKR